MNKTIRVLIGAIMAALLGYAFSFLGYVELVWVGTVVLFVMGSETQAVIFSLVGGILFDMILHAHAGVTSLSVLVALVLYVLARSLGVAGKEWQRIIALVLVFCGCFAIEALIRLLLGESAGVEGMLGFWSTGVLVNVSLTLIGMALFRYTEGVSLTRKTVKL